ncbi:MAG: response regulator, partial [Bilophila sp.]
IFAMLGIILITFILFTGHVLLVTKDTPESGYLPSLESSFTMLAPMSAMPHVFSLEEQTWIDEHPVITVSLTPEFLPAEGSDSVNAYTGISLEILRLLSRIIGVQFRVEPQSNWTNAVEDAKEWRIDLFAMAEPTLTENTGLLLTTPYVYLPGVIATNDDAPRYTTLEALNGKRVAVRYRQFWHEYLEKDYPGIKLDPVSSTLQGLFRVISGQADALVGYNFTILPRLTESTLSKFRISANLPSRSGLGMAVRSDWPEFHGILSKALNQISSTETETITGRWLDRKSSFHLPPRTVWIGLLGLEGVAAVLLVSIFWNFQLRRKVDERTDRLTAELKKSAKAEDLEKLNAELRAAMRVADAATEAKSRFLANISHEIRTPLHGIISFTELAYLKDKALPRKHQRTILDLSYALLDIVNDTLDFSKIEAGEMDMDSAPFMLDEVVLRVCDMTMRGSMARSLECVVDIEPSTPLALIGDAGRLQQILTNLMGNAIKFTPPGGRIHLQVRQGGTLHTVEDLNKAQFLFFVHDTGVGIAPTQLPQLFQPFKQADSSLTRRHGGTGLGLSIARYMVENMGGEIWVESEVGQGSTFAFSLRLGLQEQVEVLAGTTFMGLQALVVGASELGTRTMSRTLEALGIQSVSLAEDQFHVAPRMDTRDPQTCSHGDITTTVSDKSDQPAPASGWLDLLTTQDLRPDVILIDKLRGESSHPPALDLALFLEKQLPVPIPVMLVGGPREELAVSAQESSWNIEVIPAVTIRCVRSALRRLFGKTTRTGHTPLRPTQTYMTPDLSAVRLLVAEDNPVNQEIMTVLLEDTGASVRMANNGQQALDLLQQETFDLVFLDIQMPDMDGYETIRIIRERGIVLPVVALTAHAMQSDKQRCLDAGMDAYLSKPFKQTLLFDTIHTLLPNLYRTAPLKGQPSTGDAAPSALLADTVSQDATTTSAKNRDWSHLPACFSVDIVRETGLSPEQYPKILASFARNHGQDGATIRHCVRRRDWAALRDKAHALKGAAANLGAQTLREAARGLELEAQHQLDHRPQGLHPHTAGTLAATSMELETALHDVLEAIARLCPAEHEKEAPARTPPPESVTQARTALDSAGATTQYAELVTALRLATPGGIKSALTSLLVTCDPVEYPLLQTLKTHVDDYEYDAALRVLDALSRQPADSLQDGVAPNREKNHAD